MKKYRKKPVIVEAIQFYADSKINPAFTVKGLMFHKWPVEFDKKGIPFLTIHTLEGDMKCNRGDWVVKDVTGEHYVCNDDKFKKSYEEVAG